MIPQMANIFDFHTHAYPEKVAEKAVEFLNDYYNVECQGDGTIEDLLKSAGDAGVGYILVHAVATKPSQVENVNTWISGCLTANVFGFGTIHPQYDNIKEELRRIKQLGLRGIKLHPDFQEYFANDPSMDIVYANIEGVLPVLIHAGDVQSDYSSPRRIADVVTRYPNLTVIAAHLGGYSQWDEAEEYLIGRDLYIDTSSAIWALPRERAVSLVRRHGVEKVLFGTDYPLTRHREELARFEGLGLEEWEKRLILFENAKKLLNLGEL
jgi:predicted TIM-barrel fold metal-dependent hydrolase